jgi:hypothetical protein
MVGCEAAVGEVIAFAELVRVRRQRVARAVHARCRVVLAESVALAREALERAPTRERAVRRGGVGQHEDLAAEGAVRLARLRKLVYLA